MIRTTSSSLNTKHKTRLPYASVHASVVSSPVCLTAPEKPEPFFSLSAMTSLIFSPLEVQTLRLAQGLASKAQWLNAHSGPHVKKVPGRTASRFNYVALLSPADLPSLVISLVSSSSSSSFSSRSRSIRSPAGPPPLFLPFAPPAVSLISKQTAATLFLSTTMVLCFLC